MVNECNAAIISILCVMNVFCFGIVFLRFACSHGSCCPSFHLYMRCSGRALLMYVCFQHLDLYYHLNRARSMYFHIEIFHFRRSHSVPLEFAALFSRLSNFFFEIENSYNLSKESRNEWMNEINTRTNGKETHRKAFKLTSARNATESIDLAISCVALFVCHLKSIGSICSGISLVPVSVCSSGRTLLHYRCLQMSPISQMLPVKLRCVCM